jgi:hypothetical protein
MVKRKSTKDKLRSTKHTAIQSNILVLSVALLSSGKYCPSCWLIVVVFLLTSKSRHPWENNNIDVISMAYFPLTFYLLRKSYNYCCHLDTVPRIISENCYIYYCHVDTFNKTSVRIVESIIVLWTPFHNTSVGMLFLPQTF